jgi:mono/diheme cytochrome c family protein
VKTAAKSLALALVALAGCDNMWHQSHYRPYDPSTHFADGASARPPPAHTVTAGEIPTRPPMTMALLQRGRECWNAQCAVCHGEDGYGDGIVVRRGFPPPPSLHQAPLRALADRQIYDVIMQGYGIMYPVGYRLESRDRWAVVGYVRALQLSQHAAVADLRADEIGRMGDKAQQLEPTAWGLSRRSFAKTEQAVPPK